MFRSRPVQYLGLALLVLACLGVLFFPIGAPPQPQDYTLRFAATRPFDSLALNAQGNITTGAVKKSAAELVDAELVKAFPSDSGETLPVQS
jgi:hypothetical protein